ncbi:MAG: polysaccharide pyruvyl transferase family protein [Paludibacteraceae bacterium]|nr:polysaccharide pyruvyl transferase family protein [Paludibacteraceae bacterium]
MTESKCYKIIIGNSPIINGNKGCVALTYSILYILDEVMRSANCNYELFLRNSLDKDFDIHTITIGDRSISYQSFAYTLGKEHNTSPLWLLKALFWQTKINWRIWKQADFVLDIGEGDSYSDIYGLKRLKKENRIHLLAQLFGKPYGFLPQTLGPFQSTSAQRQAKQAFQRAAFVMARDTLSLQMIHKLLPSYKHAKEYIDVAFVLPYKAQHFEEHKCHVGLNISALLWHGGYRRNNQFQLREDYPTLIQHIITWFLDNTTAQIHLVAHVISQRGAIEDDYTVCLQLCEQFQSNRITVAPAFETPIEAKNYIAGLDFFMGARMHATIAAFSAGVPVLPMAYSRKFNGLYKETLNYNYLIDLKQDTMNQIIDMVQESFNKRDEIKSFIAQQTVPAQRINLIISDLQHYICLK